MVILWWCMRQWCLSWRWCWRWWWWWWWYEGCKSEVLPGRLEGRGKGKEGGGGGRGRAGEAEGQTDQTTAAVWDWTLRAAQILFMLSEEPPPPPTHAFPALTLRHPGIFMTPEETQSLVDRGPGDTSRHTTLHVGLTQRFRKKTLLRIKQGLTFV